DIQTASAFSAGILLASLTDIPGNKVDKLTTAAYCIPIFSLTVLSFSYVLFYNSWTLIGLLGLAGFIFTFLGVLGFRINVIGNLGLIVASFTIGLRSTEPLQFSCALIFGTVLFFLISLLQVYLFPNRSLRYAFSGGTKSLSELIKLKINCYNPEISLNDSYKSLNAIHIDVSNKLETIRSILLRDKRILSVHDHATKEWLAKLYLLIDLYQLLMAVDYDYKYIQETLYQGKSLPQIRQTLSVLSAEIGRLSFSKSPKQLRSFDKSRINFMIDKLKQEQKSAFGKQKELLSSVVLHFDKIIEILIKITQKNLYQQTILKEDINLKNFVASEFNFKKLTSNLNFNSAIFAFSIRISILLMVAGSFSYLFPEFRYASWMILTIILVARPSYNVTKKRNHQRLVGSIVGIIISLILLITIKNGALLIAIAVFCLYLFLAFNKPNYLTCVIFITITILLTQHIYDGEIENLLGSRLTFTILGAIFALLGSLLLPIMYNR
ncbi:MAG: FUSC family membrane protein, partial [Sphingobacterium sp.]